MLTWKKGVENANKDHPGKSAATLGILLDFEFSALVENHFESAAVQLHSLQLAGTCCLSLKLCIPLQGYIFSRLPYSKKCAKSHH